MKYNNIVLISDLDGTLLNNDGILSQENIDALEDFMSQGGKFGVATGRSYYSAESKLQGISTNIPSIFFNGGIIYNLNTNTLIKENTIDIRWFESFIEHIKITLPNMMIFIYTLERCHVVSDPNRINQEELDFHKPYDFVSIEDMRNMPWIKLVFCGENREEFHIIEEEFKRFKIDDTATLVYSSEIYLEITPKNVTKGAMLGELRNIIGNEHRIFAVGDYDNDKEMIKQADYGIAVNNAMDDVKKLAKHITVDNNSNAMVDIIYNIIDHNLN